MKCPFGAPRAIQHLFWWPSDDARDGKGYPGGVRRGARGALIGPRYFTFSGGATAVLKSFSNAGMGDQRRESELENRCAFARDFTRILSWPLPDMGAICHCGSLPALA